MSIASKLFVLTVFTKELFTQSIGGIAFDMYGYVFLFGYFLLYGFEMKYSKVIVYLTFFWASVSLTSIFLFEYPLFPFIKQIVPLFVFLSVGYDILIKEQFNLKAVFAYYVKLTFYAACFGIFQWAASLVGVNILIKEPGLLDSIAYEPSHYAVICLPAAIYSIYKFRENKMYCYVIVLSLCLTFSFTSYAVLVIGVLLPQISPKKIPIILIACVVFGNFIYLLPERILDRVEAIEVFSSEDADFRIEGTHGTTVSFSSNLEVSQYSLKKNILFGVGLGGHETSYYECFKHDSFRFNRLFGVNYNSAHSLLIRVLSEGGLVIFCLYVYFLGKTFISLKSNKLHGLLAICCLSHFISKSFKLGGYIDYGTPFFFVFLLVNYLSYKQSLHEA